jgi:ubiquinone/menaquinone biosynthesis C-methylase UbiE
VRRADEAGVGGITPTQGDATALPYDDESIDAVVLTAVLGEIPDQAAALAEIARVLRPGGRLVVGELFGDPHFTTIGALRERGEAAGLRLEERSGPPFGYFARLVKE